MKGLTDRQQEIIAFINDYLNKNLQMPTQDEIASYFSFSPAGAHYHLLALEKKGILKLHKNSARGIVLSADDRIERENISIPFFEREPNVKELTQRFLEPNISSLCYISRTLKVKKPFAFRVTSLSMKEAGILTDDIAIMENCRSANNGDIVLAYIPDSQNNVELRRFIKTPHFIELQSENENMGTIKSSNVNVYGILKAIRRNYS